VVVVVVARRAAHVALLPVRDAAGGSIKLWWCWWWWWWWWWWWCVCVCVCVCMRACVRACVCVCVCQSAQTDRMAHVLCVSSQERGHAVQHVSAPPQVQPTPPRNRAAHARHTHRLLHSLQLKGPQTQQVLQGHL
jgi:hypothetical protein